MRLLTNIGLFLFAAVLCIGLGAWALIQTIIDAIRFGRPQRVADSFFEGAYALDVYGNVTYPSLLAALLLKKGCYHFGKREETCSSVIGKNWTKGTLTWLGLGCAGFLNLIDTDHCFKYIQGNWDLPKPGRVPCHLTAAFTIILLIALAIILRIGFLIIFHA